MTKEIKEILEYPTIYNFDDEPYLHGTDYVKLRDYITNLQQENEKLKYNARGQVNDYFKDKYADEVLKNAELQQDLDKANDIIEKDRQFYKCRMDEYVELKKENEILKANAEHNDKVVDKARWNEMIYKSRCEKALNLVNNAIYENRCSCKYCNDYYLKELKNTLQGSDEE